MEEKQVCVEIEIVLKDSCYNESLHSYEITHRGEEVVVPYKTIRIHALSAVELHDMYDLSQIEEITVKLGKMFRVPTEAEIRYLKELEDGNS